MSFCEVNTTAESLTLSLKGSWRLVNFSQIRHELAQLPQDKQQLIIDGGDLSQIDTASSMLLLRTILKAGYKKSQIQLLRCHKEHEAILSLTANTIEQPAALKPMQTLSHLAQLGKDSLDFFRLSLDIISFTGQLMFEFSRAIISPKKLRKKELSIQLESVGLRSIPIIILVTFLIGIVIAYLTGIQMQKYGANIFIVDAVAIAMCRELSPLLVAIIMAGRSGSAFTAQIGTMKLNEEIDAMQTMGLSPLRVLIMPRLLALVMAMPLLVFVGNVAGIFGGMVIADLQLGVTGATFVDRLHTQLLPKTILVGLVKAPFFGFFIATIACRLGLQTENNARSVGINTTKTVVRSIVAVILLNAGFAILLSELGI